MNGNGSASSALRSRARGAPSSPRRPTSTSTFSSSRSISNGSTSVPPQATLSARIQARAKKGFHQLGLWLSTHQISALLCCSLVICSLLCPAVILYLSPSTMTGFARASSRGGGEMVWDMEGMRRQGLISSEEPVCWDRLSAYYATREIGARVVRVEQVLVSTTTAGVGGAAWNGGALSKSTLHRAAEIQRELERRLLENEVPGVTCVLSPSGAGTPARCAVLSPLGWWRDENELLQDEDVHRTLMMPPGSATSTLDQEKAPVANGSLLPITTSNTLVGIGRDRHGRVKGAHKLALTFFLEDATASSDASPLDSIGSAAEIAADQRTRAAWRSVVRDVVSGRGWPAESGNGRKRVKIGEVSEAKGAPQRVILKFLPWLFVVPNARLLEQLFFGVGYLVVAYYVHVSIRTLTQLNSKAGLLFTGLVELTSSGVMSLSICWLMGWSIALIPWNLLGFLVLVCGVDNMLLLANAIAATDMNAPVPERVAAALTAVGPSTAATLAGELAFAGTVAWLVDIAVIRQILRFASVVLVVDFLLEMTFFATILSIDVQRLELADLLQQQSRRTTSALPATPSDVSSEEDDEMLDSSRASLYSYSLASIASRVLSALKARAARTMTFSFLLVINSTLTALYGPDHFLPAFCSETALSPQRPLLAPSLSAEMSRSLRRGQQLDRRRGGARGGASSNEVAAGAGAAFWRLINPSNASSVHVYVEPPTAVRLFDDGALAAAPESNIGGLIVEPSLVFRVGVIVAPILLTSGVLYLLLLYLLKDADLLEIERTRAQRERADRRKVKSGAGVRVVRIKGRNVADVELLASSSEAIASWAALDGHVSVCRYARLVAIADSGKADSDASLSLHLPLAADPPTLVSLALDPTSRFCAAVTMSGRVLLWSLERRLLVDCTPADDNTSMQSYGRATAVMSIGLSEGDNTRERDGLRRPAFVSLHESGAVAVWDPTACTITTGVEPLPSKARDGDDVGGPLQAPPTRRTRQVLIRDSASHDLAALVALAKIDVNSGRLSLFEPRSDASLWPQTFNERVTTADNPITALAIGMLSSSAVLLVGTADGILKIYSLPQVAVADTRTASQAPLVAHLGELDGPIRQIRLAPVRNSTRAVDREICTVCGDALPDGAVVVFSTKSRIKSLRVASVSVGATEGGCACIGKIGSGAATASNGTGGQLLEAGSVRTPRKVRRASQGLLPTIGRGGSSDDMPTATGDDASSMSTPLRKTPPSGSGTPSASSSPSARISIADSGTSATTTWSSLQMRDLFSTSTEERGGWEMVEGKVVGLRRMRGVTSEDDEGGFRFASSWQAWSTATRLFAEVGHSELDALLAGAMTLELHSPPTEAAVEPTSPSLRQRRSYNLNGNTSASPDLTSRPSRIDALPTIRFENVDLPFSRARPVISALGGTAIAAGLGNQLVVIAPRAESRVPGAGLLSLSPSRARMKTL